MLALLDAFAPTPKPTDPAKLLQVRVIIGSSFLSIMAGLTFWMLQVFLGLDGWIQPHVYFVIMGTCAVTLLKLSGSVYGAATVQGFGFLSYLLWISWLDGGIESYILPGFMVMPLTAVLMNGVWAGAAWAGATLFSLLAIAFLQPDKTLLLSEEGHYIMLSAASVLATFAICLLALIIEVTKMLSFADLESERRKAESVSERVRNLLESLSHSLVKVNQDSSDISAKARQTADSMQEQTHHANTLFDGMAKFKQQLNENADRSVKVAEDASQVGERVSQTGEVMSRSNKDMAAVSKMLSGAAAKIEELTRRSEEITSIVEVIQSVAEQTNLLALNAAIEAARAGEHGRGFAVVADEVRGLAERTHNSTGEISSQVGSIVSVTQEAMESMTQATALMQTGKENAGKADEALQSVVASSNDVAQFLRTLASDSEQQRDLNEQMTEKFEAIRGAIEGAFGATSEIAGTIVSLQKELASMSESANSLQTQE